MKAEELKGQWLYIWAAWACNQAKSLLVSQGEGKFPVDEQPKIKVPGPPGWGGGGSLPILISFRMNCWTDLMVMELAIIKENDLKSLKC